MSPCCRKSVGFDQFCVGARLEHTESAGHICIGSRNVNRIADTKRRGAMDGCCDESEPLGSTCESFVQFCST